LRRTPQRSQIWPQFQEERKNELLWGEKSKEKRVGQWLGSREKLREKDGEEAEGVWERELPLLFSF